MAKGSLFIRRHTFPLALVQLQVGQAEERRGAHPARVVPALVDDPPGAQFNRKILA